MNIKNIILILAVNICTNVVYSQDTIITERDTIIKSDKIEVDQVEVIKAFEAKLSDAERISVSPSLPKITPVEKTYNYQITIVPIDIEYPDPIIKPLAMNPDGAKNVDNFYARLGYGDLKSPYADVSYQLSKGDEYDFLISGHHYGVDDTKNLKHRMFSESDLSINGGLRIGENNKLHIDLGGEYDQRFLYDTVYTALLSDTADVGRNILNIDASLKFANIETTEKGFDYAVGVNGGYLSLDGRQETTETRFGASLYGEKHFSKNFSVFIDGDAQFSDLSFASVDNPLQRYVTLKPGFRTTLGNLTLSASGDIFIDNNGTHPFVEAEARYTIMENRFQIFAGADQKTTDNSFTTKYGQNPFVSPLAIEQRNTISNQYYAGIRGNLKSVLSFTFSGGYEDITDQRYDNNRTGILMRQLFDDVTNVFINANVEFKVNDKLTVGGIVNQNFFDTDSLESPINISEYSYNAYASSSLLNNKLKIRADLILGDKIFWINRVTNEIISGNTQLDLNLAVDFYVTKNIAIWAKANNLLDREYLNYHYYPGIGRNLLGGILVKF